MQTATPVAAAPIDQQLTNDEAARVLHVSTQTLRKWVRDDPDFPRPARCGRRLLFSSADLTAYLARRRGEVAHAVRP